MSAAVLPGILAVSQVRHFRSGFSLVETALAIGIIAFAFVGLLTLLPVGLAQFRESIDTSVGAQILQRVVTDAEQTDFDTLTGLSRAGTGEFFTLPTRFFDDQGVEVVPQIPGRPTNFEGDQIVYHVHIRGSRPGPNTIPPRGSSRFTSLPASTPAARFAPRDSTILTIQIAHKPGSDILPLDERLLWSVTDAKSAAAAISTFSVVITRNGFPRPITP